MSAPSTYGIASGILSATSVSIEYVYPYFSVGNVANDPTPRPAISVYCSGILSDFEAVSSSLPRGDIMVLAAAIPAGDTGPANTLELLSGYVMQKKSSVTLPCVKVNDSPTYPSHSITQIVTSSKCVNDRPFFVTISGNAYYDVYAAHVLTSSDGQMLSIAGYSSMQVISGVLTRAPYPNPKDDLNNPIEDHGETVPGNVLTTFKFIYEPKHPLLANSGIFETGQPASNLAGSGMIQMSCSGVSSGYFFPALYNGTNESATPVYQYCNFGETLTWKVPKISGVLNTQSVYSAYDFRINYIDLSGNLSGSSLVRYSSKDLMDWDKSPVSLGTNWNPDTKGGSEGPYFVEIGEDNGRSRMATGLRDIDLVVVQYNEKGTYVSTPYTSEKPIYALSIEANESNVPITGFKIWDTVKWYIQFEINDNGKWYRISPKPRVNELDSAGKNVPNIYVLDTNLFAEDRVMDLYNTVAFVNLNKEQYNFRIKVEMDTNVTGSRGRWTPQIFDYRVSVIDREALVSSNFERYLFN